MPGAVELRNALQDSFSVDLPASLALDYPTAAAIAAHIASLLPHSIPAAGPAAQLVPQRQPAVSSQLLRRRVAAPQRHPAMPVSSVIVGLSARFPGPAADAADFWHNINASIDLPEQVRAPYLLWQHPISVLPDPAIAL